MSKQPDRPTASPLAGSDDWQTLYGNIFDAVQDGLSVIDAGLNIAPVIIEDEQAALNTVARILSRLGYSVLAAGSGEEALKRFDNQAKIDPVVTDVVMPAISGPDLMSRIAELEPGVRTRCMSGYPDEAISD